jgi:hypothetical protein
MGPPARSSRLVVVALLAAGCAPHTDQVHAVSPRIELRDNGDAVKDGKVVSLEEVTRCNPAAHDEALRARDHARAGLIVGIVGALGLFASAVTGVLWSVVKPQLPAWVGGVGLGGSVGFLGVMVGGSVVSLDRAHARNAVRLYNDGSPPCGPARDAALPALTAP